MKIIENKIKEYAADTAREFWDLLSPEKELFKEPCDLLYRGQANAAWFLEPSLHRKGNNPSALWGKDNVGSDEQIFSEFTFLLEFVENCDSIGLKIPSDSREFRSTHLNRNSPPHFDQYVIDCSLWPNPGLIELMAVAQHHGLPTRLLDWTRRSYVAGYFAASDALANLNEKSNDRLAVWVLDIERQGLFEEFEVVRVPGGNNQNIAAQSGMFTLLRQRGVRGQPFEGSTCLDEYFNQKSECPLMKLTVPCSEAGEIVRLCKLYGVTAATIYPDFYGAAKASLDNQRFNMWLKDRQS